MKESEKPPWFVKKVNRLFTTNSKRSFRHGYFRPSSIDECARANQYQFLGVDEYPDIDLRSLRRMRRGTVEHDVWYDLFVEAGLDVRGGYNEKEVFFEHRNPNIRGKWDWIVKDEDGLEWLIEWKSTQSLPLYWGQNVQWHMYAKVLGIPRGFVVKEDPVTWKLTPILMEYDENFANDIFDWLQEIQVKSCMGEIIPRDERCGVGKPWRNNCSLFHYCWSDRGDDPFKEYAYDRPGNIFLEGKKQNGR